MREIEYSPVTGFGLPWKLSFIPHSERMALRRDIYGNAYTCSHIRFGSMFGRAANPEFRRSLFMAHALASRAVRQPLQVAPSNKWSWWVRADNTGHVDLVNLNAVSGFCRDLGQTSSCYKERVGTYIIYNMYYNFAKERRFLSRSRRIEGDEDLLRRREAEIKAFVVDTHTAMAEAKGDAPVTSTFNYAHWTPGHGLYAPNYVKKLIISLLPPAQAGIMLEHEHIQHIISLNSNISLLYTGRREINITQAWKDFVRLLGGPEASSHHCLIYFVKQSCRQFNGPNYIKLGTA
ncbi:hypothetical protein ALC56_10172 [Trachymyrmex septentrionalis]|uniref:Uncharacterized protein n=1 Tax=Trachymyrmex septentrionalis TaxID=34720 RepID=A0A195F610_9HYME|nr:hypothetical protein ALC56_10172 [Trachymyrmex septentrionalis]